MKYFIYENTVHEYLVPSFLKSAALAHSEPVRSIDWFTWKFIQRPLGSTVLSCASDKDEIVGCVAFAPRPIQSKNRVIEAAISFETFVHPNYQRQGLFSILLEQAEKECLNRGIKLLLNFPNSNSLEGFKKKGWVALNSPSYIISPRFSFRSLIKLRYLKRPLIIGDDSNVNLVTHLDNFDQKLNNKLKPIIPQPYLQWRFNNFKKGYGTTINDLNYLLYRKGRRGDLKELQVLIVGMETYAIEEVTKLISKIEEDYDVVSFLTSDNHPINSYLRLPKFIKVPNKTNFCAKILGDKIPDFEFDELIFEGNLYHTY